MDEENQQDNRRVFYLTTPRQLFLKFLWEAGNLRHSLGVFHGMHKREHEFAAYHAYNAAVTAWHLTDWIWKCLPEHARIRLASELNFKITRNQVENLKSFQLALRHRSRAIDICWDVANGSKHLDTHRESKVDAKVDVKMKRATVGEFRSGQPLQTISFDFLVKWNGERLHLIDVFDEARDFWMQILSENGLIEPILIEYDIAVEVNRRD